MPFRVELTEQREKIFQFNHVLDKEVQQSDLYSAVNVPRLVERVVEGYHSTIFAYGQTGSGKTYTIEGAENDKLEGIIPRAIREAFQLISDRSQDPQTERGFRVYLSFMQIYN